MSVVETYRIEIKDDGRWMPAPGEATGWSRSEALRAVANGLIGLDGSDIDPADVRIINEISGVILRIQGQK